jgi:hypothetical protein
VDAVCPVSETSTHHFSCVGRPCVDPTKSTPGLVMSNLCFLHLVGYVVHVVQSTVQNVDVLFFMLGWAHYGWHNKRIMTQHVELVFSHLAGSTGHVV